jgi:eukaryotic-like serine/threonine-protein kinase
MNLADSSDSSQGQPASATIPPAGTVCSPPLRFGLYEVNFQSRDLRKCGLKVRLPYQSFQILAMLLRNPGQVVTREKLRRELWPSDVFVDFERGLNSAMQRLRTALRDSPRKPRYIETLPKHGYRFIATVELVPQNALLAASTTNVTSTPSQASSASSEERAPDVPLSRRNSWRFFAAAALVIVLLLMAYAWRRLTGRQDILAHGGPRAAAPAVPARQSIAVLGFRNISGSPRVSWLSTAFTEMLSTEMAGGDHFRTIAEEQVARAKLDLSLADRDSYAQDTLTKIRRDLGCDYVVVGSYLALEHGGKLRLDARVQSAITGETVASVAVAGSQGDLFGLIMQAGENLRAKLGIEPLTLPQSEEVKAALPADREAARLYAEGLTQLRALNHVAARDLLSRAVQLEPKYSPVYSALASAYSALGYAAQAKAAARKATALSGSLSPSQRLEAEARYREMNGQWAQSLEIYKQLERLDPDNVDYGLHIAKAQNSMGNNTDAAATLAALRRSPSAQQDEARIDLAEAVTAGILSDYKGEQKLAAAAAAKAEITGARFLMGRAWEVEGWAQDDLGELEDAKFSYAAAQKTFIDSGDLDEAALVSMNIGLVLAKQGQLEGARAKMEEAGKVFRSRGDQARLAATLVNLAEGVYQPQGEFPKAEALFQEALAIFNQIGELDALPEVTFDIAQSEERQGKLREADELLQGLVEQLRRDGKKNLLGDALDSQGSVAEARGNMQAALQHDREAVALFRDMGDKEQYARAERQLGPALLIHGDTEGATQALNDALKTDRDIQAKAEIALDQVALAEVFLEQRRSQDLNTVRAALDELRLEKMTDDEIEAEIVMARSLIQEQKTLAASETLRRVRALSAKSYNPTVRFDAALAAARLYAAEYRFADSIRTLRSALPSTVKADCVRCQLEARLELGEIELQAGNRSEGSLQLRQVADEAQRRGFGLIAQSAAANSR